MIETLLEPFAYPFMVRALLAALIVGILCPLVGSFVVLRGLAFLGDALAHAVFPGVVVAYLLGSSLLAGGLVAGVAVALAIGAVSSRTRLDEQSAIGVVFPVAFAVGVLLLARLPTFAADLTHILFGNLLGVAWADLAIAGPIAALVVAVVLALRRPLAIATFDPMQARLVGIPVNALSFGLLLAVAASVVLAVQVAGNLLVLSLLVTPAATAWLVARSLPALQILAMTFGVASAAGGLYLSWFLAAPPGPLIVLVGAGLFALTAGLRAILRFSTPVRPSTGADAKL